MYIRDLFEDKDIGITYSYTKRHTLQAYLPDVECESVNKEIYTVEDGNLFNDKPVSWKGSVLLDGSVDINVSMNERYFVDHISLVQSEKSKIGSIDVLTFVDGELKRIGSFAKGEYITNKNISIGIGYFCSELIIRLNCAYLNMGIEKLDVHVASELENTVYPIPESVELTGGVLPFSKVSKILADSYEAKNAAEYLCQRMSCAYDCSLSVDSKSGEIIFRLDGRVDDGYTIDVTEDKCVLTAGSKRGLIYACDTLVSVSCKDGIKCGHIFDKPMMDMRGVHFALPSRKDIPFLKKMIREVFVPMRYNMVFIQLSGVMQYEKFPEINEKWLYACEMYEKGEWPKPAHYGFVGRDILSKEEIAELCEYIRFFGIEIVPEIQCLSHSQYITTAYPFLAEIEKSTEDEDDLYADDAKPTVFYHHNMCPSHPDYYKYVLGIAEEVVDLFKPERFLHMGHDEVYLMGKCEKCAKRGAAAVFIEEVTRLNEFVKSKGLTMMIWADMLQNRKHAVPEAIDSIPRDIILLDFVWYFFLGDDIEDNLLNAGFKVMMGNMYSSHYTRYNSRSRKPGIIGAEVSTWVACDEHSYAYEGKMYDLVYSANTMWSDKYSTEYRRSYNEIVKNILKKLRLNIGEIDVSGEKTAIECSSSSLKNIPNELLWHIPYDNAALISDTNDTCEFDYGDRADVFTFVHATNIGAERVMWTPAKKIGEYELVYDDGTVYSHPMLYGDSIYKASSCYGEPIASPLFRHEGYVATYTSYPICGKDSNGKDYTLLECLVKNPYPKKKVEKIVARHTHITDADILIFSANAIKNK